MAIYSEYMIEWDDINLVVYVSGLDSDGFWDELYTHDEVNNPEEFAEGYAARMIDQGLFVTIVKVDPELDLWEQYSKEKDQEESV